MTIKLFDLNIEEVLENWDIEHGLREIISNALDEQQITGSQEIEIKKDLAGKWHIRDFGRGIQIEHFTLNENPEKLNSKLNLIGKFGVGLKDALATFNRRGVLVIIQSKFGSFQLKKSLKSGFSNIFTLHVEFNDNPIDIEGTDFIFEGISNEKMDLAKSFFLKFNDEILLDSTLYGEIYNRKSDGGKVYINGVFAADEPNFMFTYNITNITQSIKKKLNRERLNVGRTTYSSRIKDILLSSENDKVRSDLIEQARNRYSGNLFDEFSWIEISQKALNLLHNSRQAVFLTEEEIIHHPEIIDWAKRDRYEVITISGKEKDKLESQMNSGGPEIRTSDVFVSEINNSFEYKFINYNELDKKEILIYNSYPKLVNLVDLPKWQVPKLLISETMRLTNDDTRGIWDPSLNAIIIKRTQLAGEILFAGTVLHELAHKLSGAPDCSRIFEGELTQFLGKVSAKVI
ncbi:MAG: ATP-binding protein [Chloroflexi bacterium]|nr:ATP-binding protein [Chloroflexota bacterium]